MFFGVKNAFFCVKNCSPKFSPLTETLNNLLYPQFVKKLRLKLIEEAEDGIIEECRRQFRYMIKQGPIANPNVRITNDDSDDEDEDDRKPDCILCMVASDQQDVPVFGVVLKRDGDVVMYRKYPRLMARARFEGTELQNAYHSVIVISLFRFLDIFLFDHNF